MEANMAMLSSVAGQGLQLATCTGKAVADQGLKLARGTGKAARSAGTACLSVADKVNPVAWKLARSTGKAAWIAGTSAIVLVLPLAILVGQEYMYMESEQASEQMSFLLGTGGHP